MNAIYPIGLLTLSILLFVGGVLGTSDEVLVMAFVAAGAAGLASIGSLRGRLFVRMIARGTTRGVEELQSHLEITSGELDTLRSDLERLKQERSFDLQLLSNLSKGADQYPPVTEWKRVDDLITRGSEQSMAPQKRNVDKESKY